MKIKISFLIFFVLVLLWFNNAYCSTSTDLTTIVPQNDDLSSYIQYLYDDYENSVFAGSIDISNCYILSYLTNDYLEIYISSQPLVRNQNDNTTFYSVGYCVWGEFYYNGSTVVYSDFAYNNSTVSSDYGIQNISSALSVYVNRDYTIFNRINGSNTDVYLSYSFSNYPMNAVVYNSNNQVVLDVQSDNIGGGSSGDSSNDYTNVLNHIDSDLHSIDNTTTDISATVDGIATDVDSIDNNVYQIRVILENQNDDEVVNAIGTTSSVTQNTITNTSQQTQNLLTQQIQQSQNNFNVITNTTNYNTNDVFIDTSFNTIQDVNGVDNFIVRVYNIIYAFFDDLDTTLVVNITIPLPFTDKSFVLSTSSLQNFYAEHVSLSNLITVSWYFVFGVYIFRLAYKFWLSSVTGSVFRDTEGFTADLDGDNLVKSLFL